MKKKLIAMMLCITMIMGGTMLVHATASSYTFSNGYKMTYSQGTVTSSIAAETYTGDPSTAFVSLFVYDKNGSVLRSDLQTGGWDNVKLSFRARAIVSNSSVKSGKSYHNLLDANGIGMAGHQQLNDSY